MIIFQFFSISNLHLQIKKEHASVKRDFNKENSQLFVNEIVNVCWSVENHDANEAYNDFLQKFLNIYESCFPIKKSVKKKFKINHGLINHYVSSVIKKYYLYRRYVKKPTPERHEKYKNFRNKVTEEIKETKRVYFRGKFQNAAGNGKHMENNQWSARKGCKEKGATKFNSVQ